jgi:KUP system potassium uptake protein
MAATVERTDGDAAGPSSPGAPRRGRHLGLLTVTALGIVYGDIGTSPLYAVRESLLPGHGVPVTPVNVLGVLSLIIWSLLLIISIKYLVFVLQADNQGEGGILALTSLVVPTSPAPKSRFFVLTLLGLFGTAMLYGEGLITPAISVLSAVEGLKVATPLFEPYVETITIVVLIGLFLVQSRGTTDVGKVFGPIMFVWFVTLAILGLVNVVQTPEVLGAIDPRHAWQFFQTNGWRAFMVLGSVVLAITGAEALYADMGHFGRGPIRIAWFSLVLPALVLCYLGQGAVLIRDPAAIVHPFFHLAPSWALLPLVGLATIATVIASQALISGAFSLTMQAVQLGFAPRVHIAHTSALEIGQIYVPGINWGLMVACIGLVLGFRSSSNLAAAYGLAVTTTMVVTTILFFFVLRQRWGWPIVTAVSLTLAFLLIDGAFWTANLPKVPHGGWLPLVIGVAVFTLLTTWKQGRRILADRIVASTPPWDKFYRQIQALPPIRVPGTAVYMYSRPEHTPPALVHNLRHNGVLHDRIILLSVLTKRVPHVRPEDRVQIQRLGQGFYQIILTYGFMETVNVPEALASIREEGFQLRLSEITYFLGRETVFASERPGMALWREKLFSAMTRNARSATSFFGLPPDQVVEMGSQIEI